MQHLSILDGAVLLAGAIAYGLLMLHVLKQTIRDEIEWLHVELTTNPDEFQTVEIDEGDDDDDDLTPYERKERRNGY